MKNTAGFKLEGKISRFVCFVWLFLCFYHVTYANSFDPYEILRVNYNANFDEIKSAYRKRAKDTHPDKNSHLDQNIAAANFRAVSEAFDILSNPSSRKRYDAKRNQHQRANRDRQAYEARQREEMMFEVRASQARLLLISVPSLDHLKNIMLDFQGRFKKHFILVFVPNKAAEKILLDTLLFPYPHTNLAGDDLLQFMKLRYNKDNEMSRFFQAPAHIDTYNGSNPHIIFGKKGDRLDQFMVYNDRYLHTNLKEWIRAKLTMPMIFRNKHHSNVDLYMVEGSSKRHIRQLKPDGKAKFNLLIGQTIVAMDSRVNKFISPNTGIKKEVIYNSILGKWNIINDEEFEILTKKCTDLSEYCLDWLEKRGKEECDRHHEFMHNICPVSCNVCKESLFSSMSRKQLRKSFNSFSSNFVKDTKHVLLFRRNVMLLFFEVGLVAGVIACFLNQLKKSRDLRHELRPVMRQILFLIMLVGCFYGFSLYFIESKEMLKKDLQFIWKTQKSVYAILPGFTFVLYWVPAFKLVINDKYQPRMIPISMILSIAHLARGFLFNEPDIIVIWKHLYRYRKNALAALLISGALTAASLHSLRNVLLFIFSKRIPLLLLCTIGLSYTLISGDESFSEDVKHVIDVRKNVAVTFQLIGSVIGFLLTFFRLKQMTHK